MGTRHPQRLSPQTQEVRSRMETVLITGANRGIGLELTKQFLKLGYHVIATYRNEASCERLEELKPSGRLSLYQLEVTSEASISALANQLKSQPIDILINNAGVLGPETQSIESVNTAEWLDTFAVNTIAPFNVSTMLLDNLRKSSNPRLITISSELGSLIRESSGMLAYSSSKAAINKVMRILALELKPEGIIVCPLHPGWVKTDMGGPDAKISIEESVEGLVELIRKLTLENTGQFLTWKGEEHTW